MRRAVMTGVVAVLMVGAVCVHAEDSAAVKELRGQVKELYEQKRGLERKLHEIRMKVDKSPELADARKACNETRKAREEEEKADLRLAKLREAEAVAREALSAVIKDKVDSNRSVVSARKKIAKLADKKSDLEMDKAIAELKLNHRSSPVQRELEKDEALKALRAKAHAAGHGSKESEAYRAARKEKLAGMREAQKLTSEIKECAADMSEIYEEIRELQNEIYAARTGIERGKDPDVVAARDKSYAAHNAYRKSCGEVLADAHKAEGEARTIYHKQREKILSGNKDAGPVLAQIKGLNAKMNAINKKIADTRRAEMEEARKKQAAKDSK